MTEREVGEDEVGEDEVPEPELVVDARDLLCPLPVIELARHVADVAVGRLVGVAATDVAARHDVPAWARMRGHAFVGERRAPDGAAVLVVRRTH